MQIRRPKFPKSANAYWWIATGIACGIGLCSILSGILTENTKEFDGIAPALALAIACCPLIPINKLMRITAVMIIGVVNLIVWFDIILSS